MKKHKAITYELTMVSRDGIGRLIDTRIEKHESVAFVAHNDMLALSLMSGLTVRGLHVGLDVGLVGYDNIPIAAAPEIDLTSVDQKGFNLGCLALLRALGGRKEQQLVEEGNLIVRSSSRG